MAQLAGSGESVAPLEALLAPKPDASATATAPASAEEAAEAPVDGQPWIDQRLCTACDECMAVNGELFVYDASKKAVITDPRAGPYRDIVKAATKCSSGAIHPGQPLDPNEKDLEKWIKVAEPYQ